jgi:hypothetical protein
MSKYCIIARTFISKMNKTSTQEYWLCEGVPCIIKKEEADLIYLRPFNFDKTFEITKDTYDNNIIDAITDADYVYCERYPSKKIAKIEFDIKCPLSKSALIAGIPNITNNFKLLIDKAYQDAYRSKGSIKCINMKDYKSYLSGEKVLTKLENIGDPKFNRGSRHLPPIFKEFSYNDFTNTTSFPAPIGISYEDFALPSEQNMVLIELLEQLFNSIGAPECSANIKTLLLAFNITIQPNTHKCRWCNDVINITDINQTYCSATHSINFCHIDPVIGTKPKNIYIGHCNCNREQGGYSEYERIEQALRLLSNNPEMIEKYKNILDNLIALNP